jgi:pilus assembly protein CpaC
VTSSISGSSVEYKDYGVMLGIEPNLDLYGNITARVDVSISQLDLAQAVGGQPAFKKRSTGNDVKLRPGETLVLSGLITREEQMTYSDVKWLAKLPIIGWLFRSKSFTSGETEMVIFITPRVMENLAEGDNREMLERAEKMVETHRAFVNKGLLD